jgi:hypothetical protein
MGVPKEISRGISQSVVEAHPSQPSVDELSGHRPPSPSCCFWTLHGAPRRGSRVPIPLVAESSDGPTSMLPALTFEDGRTGLGDFGVFGRQRPVACDDD